MRNVRTDKRITTMAALLSNPLRLAIVEHLRRGPSIVSDLVTALDENQATLSKQLGVLREAGLLVCRPDGRCREYALGNPEIVGGAVDALATLGHHAIAQAAECAAKRSSHVSA